MDQKLNAWLAEHVCGYERCTDRWAGAENGCVAGHVVCGETGGLSPGTNCKIHEPYPKYTSTSDDSLELLHELSRSGCHVVLEMYPTTHGRVRQSLGIIPPIPVDDPTFGTNEYRAVGQFLWEMAPLLVKKLVEDYPKLDRTKE